MDVRVNDIAKDSSFRRRLLANMPEDVFNSLTELQLAAIERALDSGRWQAHPLDIRLSLPFFWRRCYLVLLAGPERRSAERRRSERIERPLRTIGNMAVFAVFLLLLIPAAVGSFHIISRGLLIP
jgi:hypothetical protein